MDARKLAKLLTDQALFPDDVVGTLGHARRRWWCETYLRVLLLDGQHKSIEPMTAGQFGADGALIIDDTGFPQQGTHSVGVAR